MDGDDLLQGGATGVFGTLPKEPGKAEEPVRGMPTAPVAAPVPTPAAVPVKMEALATPASGGFTQLLRALNYDAVKEVQTGAESKAAAGSSQVTSFLPPAESVPRGPSVAPEPVRVASAPPAAPLVGSGGSFTQLFRTVVAEPAAKPVAETSGTKPNAAVDTGSVDSGPGSFTQMFAVPETVRPPAAVTDQASVPLPADGPFTQLFAGLDARKEHDAAPVERVIERVTAEAPAAVLKGAEPITPALDAPGSFTRMFEALGPPTPDAVVPETPTPEAATPAAGSFTQMFQALGPAGPEAGAPGAGRAAPSPPGSFTRVFQALGEAPKAEAAGGQEKPGSFTRMFGAMEGSASAPVVPPAPSSYDRPFAASAPEREGSGASRMFSTFQEPKAEARAPAFSPVEAAPMGRPPVAAAPASGGITQLLRRLDQPSQPAGRPVYAPATAQAPAAAPVGSFTGVYGELGTPVAPAAAPVSPPMAAAPPVAGPSEFTRLINASALREAALRGDGGAPGAGATAAPSSGGGGGMAMPAGLPGLPKAPSVKLPETPKMEMPKVEAPKPAAPPAGMQQYVPLLLILVIFLLLAILVAVVFLMKK